MVLRMQTPQPFCFMFETERMILRAFVSEDLAIILLRAFLKKWALRIAKTNNTSELHLKSIVCGNKANLSKL